MLWNVQFGFFIKWFNKAFQRIVERAYLGKIDKLKNEKFIILEFEYIDRALGEL